MKLRRGFKADAERTALRLRQEIGLVATAPIDVEVLAKHVGVGLAPISGLARATEESRRQLLTVDPGAVSAFTIANPDGDRLVIYNDAHSKARRAASVGHELSHVILCHTMPSVIKFGCRDFDPVAEDEATWQADCILVPADAAVLIARRGLPIAEEASRFGVSVELMRKRLQLTGALRRAAHGAARDPVRSRRLG